MPTVDYLLEIVFKIVYRPFCIPLVLLRNNRFQTL